MLKGNTVVGILTAMLLLPASPASAQAVISEEAKATEAGFNLLPVYAEIEKLEYDIKWQDSVDTLQTPNRAQNMRFSFYNNGFTAEPRDPNWNTDRAPESWRATFLLESLGSTNPFSPLAQPQVENVKNTAEYAFDEVVVNYTNDFTGLQQTFLVKNKPGDGPVELRIAVTVENLVMGMDATGQFIVGSDPITGDELLHYTGLRVFGRDWQGTSGGNGY